MAMNQKQSIEQVKADAERLTLKRIQEDQEAKNLVTPVEATEQQDNKKR